MRKKLVLIAAILVFAIAQAQRRAPVIIKGTGERVPQSSGPKPPPPPPALSPAAMAAVLKSLNLQGPGTLFMKLTPRNTFAAGRGSLSFNNPQFVDGYMDWSSWYGIDDGTRYAGLRLKSEGAGRHYLFDCLVGTTQTPAEQGPFKLWRNQKMVQTFDADEIHLIFVLETADDGWNEFRIIGGPKWYFFGCEVTRL